MGKAILLDSGDNVATVTSEVAEGEVVEVLSPGGEVVQEPVARGDVPFGHKLALVGFDRGDSVVKYGEVIGVASRAIAVGEWVHTHNLESATVPTSAYGEAG